ncbi:MAG: DUF4369 domain-containing protein [Bacteroidia bacterium]
MKTRTILTLFSAIAFSTLFGQKGYDIKFSMKGSPDTMAYIVKYIFDQQYIVDTCKNIKNGQIRFKGKEDLDKGVYTLVSQGKSIYFDFFVNENQKFTISCDYSDIVNTLKVTGSKENENFISYIRFITNKNNEFGKHRDKTKGMSKEDSTTFMKEKLTKMNEEVMKFESDFMNKTKGSFVYDVLNLKTEKNPTDIPKASNGRPDSVYQYYYYKSHFFEGVNFKDERIIRTPFFDDRIKRYFDHVILQHPDTIIQEIDNILGACDKDNLIYNVLIGHFTYKYEQSKVMGFDKVFVHVCDKYILSGNAKEVYDDETVKKIKERVDIMRNLLLESKAPELYMIDTTAGKEVLKMGFDTAKSSQGVTSLYYKNL